MFRLQNHTHTHTQVPTPMCVKTRDSFIKSHMVHPLPQNHTVNLQLNPRSETTVLRLPVILFTSSWRGVVASFSQAFVPQPRPHKHKHDSSLLFIFMCSSAPSTSYPRLFILLFSHYLFLSAFLFFFLLWFSLVPSLFVSFTLCHIFVLCCPF